MFSHFSLIGAKAKLIVCWIFTEKADVCIYVLFEGSPSPIGYPGESQDRALSVRNGE